MVAESAIEALDLPDGRTSQLDASTPPLSVDQLDLQTPPEVLLDGVVVGVAARGCLSRLRVAATGSGSGPGSGARRRGSVGAAPGEPWGCAGADAPSPDATNALGAGRDRCLPWRGHACQHLGVGSRPVTAAHHQAGRG